VHTLFVLIVSMNFSIQVPCLKQLAVSLSLCGGLG